MMVMTRVKWVEGCERPLPCIEVLHLGLLEMEAGSESEGRGFKSRPRHQALLGI